MHVAFVAFEGMTALDFVGAYDPVTRLRTMGFEGFESTTWEVHAHDAAVVEAGAGLRVEADAVGEPLDAALVVVPGGFGTRALVEDDAFLEWLRTARGADVLASVCTGSLLLGAAGFLKGRRATTHPNAYDALAAYRDVDVVEERVVDEGDVVTARGVSSSLDLGLHLVERFAGVEVRREVAAQMDYLDPHGPGGEATAAGE
jgi:cyclohexyl-isocyanide hydratase